MTTEIYKRYRPKKLSKVVGNEETVNALTSMLSKKKVPHTILFTGPSGCGKTTLARILRARLKCHDMDFVELNCARHRGIDTIKGIQRLLRLAPTGGKARLWLLDEAHMMTREAQNASLKMLEDTPSHVYFILCTTDPQKLIPTIRTRCTQMPVVLLTDMEMKSLVRRISKREGIDLNTECLLDLVENASGSPRKALVLLDKVSGLDEGDRLAALRASDDSEEVIALCRALMKKTGWVSISKILRGLKEEPESIRWAVLGYARSCLLGKGGQTQAYHIICAFESHFYDSKQAGLARACYEAVFGT